MQQAIFVMSALIITRMQTQDCINCKL